MNNSIKYELFVCTRLNVFNTVIQHYKFNSKSVICLLTVKWVNSSIWEIAETLTAATITPGESEPRSNGNKGVLYIPQAPRKETSLSEAV